MRAQEYLNYPVLDIIFEGRNKTYGAYVLRTNYEQNMRKALIFGLLGIAFIAFSSMAYAKIKAYGKADVSERVVEVTLSDYKTPVKKTEPLAAKKATEAPKPLKDVTSFLPPVVKADPLVVETPPKPIAPTTEFGATTTQGSGATTIAATVGTSDDPKGTVEQSVEPPIIVEPDIVINVVEQQAEFPDGYKALYKWLSGNIKYPAVCRENGISGKVTVRFIVEKDGQVTQPEVLRSAHPSLDAEALRVVKQMPKWKPGKQRGHAVRSYFTLPIKFALE